MLQIATQARRRWRLGHPEQHPVQSVEQGTTATSNARVGRVLVADVHQMFAHHRTVREQNHNDNRNIEIGDDRRQAELVLEDFFGQALKAAQSEPGAQHRDGGTVAF